MLEKREIGNEIVPLHKFIGPVDEISKRKANVK